MEPPNHPYYPPSLDIPGYAPTPDGVLPVTIALFVAWLVGGVGMALWAARAVHSPSASSSASNPAAAGKKGGMSTADQLCLCWFVLCGLLHCFFEGFWISNHQSLATSQSFFAHLWKEYALSDARYMISDPFVLTVETLTVYIWGPLSFLTAFIIASGSKKTRKIREILQIIVSVGHLYGVALYFGTCYFAEQHTGVSYSRPEWLYYWVYYVGLNILWAIVPTVLLFSSVRSICLPDAPAPDAVEKQKKIE